jgi:hypothetical protein
MLEAKIGSRNESTEHGYRKDHDALVTGRTDRGERKFALEREPTPQARRQHVEICADIVAKEPWTRSSILPHYHLLSFMVAVSQP